MTSSFDPHYGGGEPRSPQVRELHPVSPWLVVESWGVDAERLAEAASRQCHIRGVEFDRQGIDAPLRELWNYHGMVLTCAEAGPHYLSGGLAERIATIVGRYRRYQAYGAAAVLAGAHRMSMAGVVQLAAPPALLRDPIIEEVRHQICRMHPSDQSTSPEVDFFSIFDPLTGPMSMPTDSGSSVLEQDTTEIWTYLISWGITSPEQAAVALEVIEQVRVHYESEEFPAMRRPFGDVIDWNRLDFVLHEPRAASPKGPGERKKWNENGARAGRQVLAELQRADPAIDRPVDRRTKKGLQLDIYQLYTNLTAVADYSVLNALMVEKSRQPMHDFD